MKKVTKQNLDMNKNKKDIFERQKAGEVIRLDDPDYPLIYNVIINAIKKTAELNTLVTDDFDKIRSVFSELIGKKVDDTFILLPPFYTDYGLNINIGKNALVNHGCTFMDRGGITIEDNVLIAPKVNLITTNHPIEISERQHTYSKPIVIKKNAWIGAASTIMPNVTIGENAIVAAGSVVTKDVPPNTTVAGVPAKIIKNRN